MIGRRSTNSPNPAGSVTSAMSRMPSDVRSISPVRSLRAIALVISGRKVVAIDIASRPWGSTNQR